MLPNPDALSSTRVVPSHIPRPDYVSRGIPARSTEPWTQPPEVIAAMRPAGRLAARALQAGGAAVTPGVTSDEIDRVVHEFVVAHGAYPSTLGYNGYPKSCSISLNEVICHGVPDTTIIRDRDIVNVDVICYLDGVHAATNATFLVGEVSDEDRLLVERTREAMLRGIRVVRPGRPLNVVGRVIEVYAKRFGYGVIRDFTGHGIGRSLHNELVVPHYDDPRVDTVLEAGMTFTIQPMLTLGTVDYEVGNDGWTVATKDRRRCAQFEHTVLVTADGVEILTG